MASICDRDLIRASLGDPQQFSEIFDRHYDDVARFVGRRIERAAAEEVAAETFLIAFRDREKFDLSRDSARPWLFGIAINLTRRHGRSEHSRLSAYARLDSVEAIDTSEDAIERADSAASRAALVAGLAELTDEERDVLLLFAWAQFSYEEIAEALSIPIGTVRSRLARARSAMRQRLNFTQPDHQPEGVSRG